MADFTKLSPDGGPTMIYAKDAAGRVMSEQLIRDTVGWTGKNLLNNTATNGSNNNATWIVNPDKTVLVNSSTVLSGNVVIPLGTITGLTNIILSGCPVGGGSEIYQIQLQNITDNVWILPGDYGNGATLTLDPEKEYRVNIVVRNGVTISNKTFAPMIRLATITDGTYEPYHGTVNSIIGQLGARNLHTYPYVNANPYEMNGITFTANENQSVDLDGTATADADYVTHGRLINQANPLFLPKGKYVYYLAGETESFGYLTLATTYNGSYSGILDTTKTNEIGYFEITDNTNSDYKLPDGSVLVSPHIGVSKNKTLSHKIVWPVIELAENYTGKFTNGSMTNVELTYDRPYVFHHPFVSTTTLSTLITSLIQEYKGTNQLYNGKTLTIGAAITSLGYFVVTMTQDNNRVIGHIISDVPNLYVFHYNLDNQTLTIKQATLTAV